MLWTPCVAAVQLNSTSVNDLRSPVHTILVIIMRSVSLNIKDEDYHKVTVTTSHGWRKWHGYAIEEARLAVYYL